MERCLAWSESALAARHGPSTSDFVEEGPIDGDILDCPGSCLDAEIVLLEKLTEEVAVDQVDRRGAVTGCLLLASAVNDPVVISKPLSPRPAIAPRKSRTAPAPTLPR